LGGEKEKTVVAEPTLNIIFWGKFWRNEGENQTRFRGKKKNPYKSERNGRYD